MRRQPLESNGDCVQIVENGTVRSEGTNRADRWDDKWQSERARNQGSSSMLHNGIKDCKCMETSNSFPNANTEFRGGYQPRDGWELLSLFMIPLILPVFLLDAKLFGLCGLLMLSVWTTFAVYVSRHHRGPIAVWKYLLTGT